MPYRDITMPGARFNSKLSPWLIQGVTPSALMAALKYNSCEMRAAAAWDVNEFERVDYHDGQRPISLSGIGKGYGQNVGTCHGHNHPPIPTRNGLPFLRLFRAYPRSRLVHVLWGGK